MTLRLQHHQAFWSRAATADTTNFLKVLSNTELAKVNQWMSANNLVDNATKTIALHIPPNMRYNSGTTSYVLKGEAVCSSNSGKYLEITIDSRLSFKTYINNVESKISRSVGVIAKLSYYLPHNTLFALDYSLVYSHFHYALPVWSSTYKTYLIRLQNLSFT